MAHSGKIDNNAKKKTSKLIKTKSVHEQHTENITIRLPNMIFFTQKVYNLLAYNNQKLKR